MKTFITIIVILLAIITVCYMTADLLNVNKCSICGDVTIGKQNAIKDKPVCDRCYSEIEFHHL